jgi:predicted dehydrogenase
MSAIRVAVVGLGYWGPNLVRNFNELACAEVVAVCDRDADRLELIQRRFPAVQTHTSIDDVLADETIDAVALATPVSTHFPLGRAVLEAGKHVFVEKPLASSSSECLELTLLAESRGLVLMPGHTFLYSPPVVAVRNLIESGELGDLYFVSTSRVNLGLHQKDVSVTWDLAPHDFSILRYWLDETPAWIRALSRGCIIPSIPDVAFIDLEFASGPIAHVELSWLAPSKLRRTTIVGSRKMVVYDDTSAEPVRVFDSGVVLRDPETFGEYRLTYRTGDIVSPRIDAAEPLSAELRDFCDAVMSGTTPRSSATVGLQVVQMIEAADRSHASGGANVAVEAVDPLSGAQPRASALDALTG